jgi:hypothetical protein
MRDSMQYSKSDKIDLGMNSMSEISQSIIQNKETKFGIMQQSLKSSYNSMDFQNQPSSDVRDILAKYKQNKKGWLDEIDNVEQ